MRKAIFKLLTVALTVCMLIPLFTVGSSAKTTTKYQGKSLVILGDSIAAGFGLAPGSTDMVSQILQMPHGEFTANSWPLAIRDKYGFSKETSVNLSRTMWRCDEFLRLLDPAFEAEICKPENTFEQYMSDYLMCFTELTAPGDALQLKSQIRGVIAQADVLVFSLCSNDIMSATIAKPFMLPFYQVFGRQACYALATVTQGKLQLPTTPEGLAKFALGTLEFDDLASDARRRTQQFFKNYDRLLSIIYRLNPDVEVYTMGMTNPFKGLKTINGQDSTLFAPLTEENIRLIKNYVTKQSRYAGRVKYVDCSDVGGHGFGDAYSVQFLLDFVVHVHPNAEGHKLIAKHVSAAFDK
ncbi:MAG: SGNH/GDSL hydrolase family protein [Clostridia bacterium]|nr:SGNH/GDSL hydrolase family protein [Clostridia bacterium]MBQ3326350.1 SGNH/GDSL hydrolase family protein [Clostridia bacterium]